MILKLMSIETKKLRACLMLILKHAHPMGLISSLTSLLTAFNPEDNSVNSEDEIYRSVVKLLGKFPVLVSWVLRYKKGLPLDSFDNSLGYTENVLKLMFSKPNTEYKLNSIL